MTIIIIIMWIMCIMPAKLAPWSWAQSNFESWSPPNPQPDNRDNEGGGRRVDDGEDDELVGHDYEDIADEDDNEDDPQTPTWQSSQLSQLAMVMMKIMISVVMMIKLSLTLFSTGIIIIILIYTFALFFNVATDTLSGERGGRIFHCLRVQSSLLECQPLHKVHVLDSLVASLHCRYCHRYFCL